MHLESDNVDRAVEILKFVQIGCAAPCNHPAHVEDPLVAQMHIEDENWSEDFDEEKYSARQKTLVQKTRFEHINKLLHCMMYTAEVSRKVSVWLKNQSQDERRKQGWVHSFNKEYTDMLQQCNRLVTVEELEMVLNKIRESLIKVVDGIDWLARQSFGGCGPQIERSQTFKVRSLIPHHPLLGVKIPPIPIVVKRPYIIGTDGKPVFITEESRPEETKAEIVNELKDEKNMNTKEDPDGKKKVEKSKKKKKEKEKKKESKKTLSVSKLMKQLSDDSAPLEEAILDIEHKEMHGRHHDNEHNVMNGRHHGQESKHGKAKDLAAALMVP